MKGLRNSPQTFKVLLYNISIALQKVLYFQLFFLVNFFFSYKNFYFRKLDDTTFALLVQCIQKREKSDEFYR